MPVATSKTASRGWPRLAILAALVAVCARLGDRKWSRFVPIRIRAMVLADKTLFVAGPPDVLDPADPLAAFEGRKGAVLQAVSADNGKKLAEYTLQSPPVFDGLIAAAGRLYLACRDGHLICLAGKP